MDESLEKFTTLVLLVSKMAEKVPGVVKSAKMVLGLFYLSSLALVSILGKLHLQSLNFAKITDLVLVLL